MTHHQVLGHKVRALIWDKRGGRTSAHGQWKYASGIEGVVKCFDKEKKKYLVVGVKIMFHDGIIYQNGEGKGFFRWEHMTIIDDD